MKKLGHHIHPWLVKGSQGTCVCEFDIFFYYADISLTQQNLKFSKIEIETILLCECIQTHFGGNSVSLKWKKIGQIFK